MQRNITPFRITIILGEKPVAQIERMERITDDDGTPITARALPAEPLAFPLSEEILGAVASDALAKVAELENELAAAKTAIAEVDALKAKIAELTLKPSENPNVISKLHAAFTSTLTEEQRTAFAMPYAIVRVLVQAEQYALAAAVIQGISVPPELESAKQGLIDLLPTE